MRWLELWRSRSTQSCLAVTSESGSCPTLMEKKSVKWICSVKVNGNDSVNKSIWDCSGSEPQVKETLSLSHCLQSLGGNNWKGEKSFEGNLRWIFSASLWTARFKAKQVAAFGSCHRCSSFFFFFTFSHFTCESNAHLQLLLFTFSWQLGCLFVFSC